MFIFLIKRKLTIRSSIPLGFKRSFAFFSTSTPLFFPPKDKLKHVKPPIVPPTSSVPPQPPVPTRQRPRPPRENTNKFVAKKPSVFVEPENTTTAKMQAYVNHVEAKHKVENQTPRPFISGLIIGAKVSQVHSTIAKNATPPLDQNQTPLVTTSLPISPAKQQKFPEIDNSNETQANASTPVTISQPSSEANTSPNKLPSTQVVSTIQLSSAITEPKPLFINTNHLNVDSLSSNSPITALIVYQDPHVIVQQHLTQLEPQTTVTNNTNVIPSTSTFENHANVTPVSSNSTQPLITPIENTCTTLIVYQDPHVIVQQHLYTTQPGFLITQSTSSIPQDLAPSSSSQPQVQAITTSSSSLPIPPHKLNTAMAKQVVGELEQLNILKKDDHPTDVIFAAKDGSGDVHAGLQKDYGTPIKITSMGSTYFRRAHELNSPPPIFSSEPFKPGPNSELNLGVLIPDNKDDIFLLNTKQMHMVVSVDKDTDKCYIIGYLTSQQVSLESLSDTQFKDFYNHGTFEPSKKRQYFQKLPNAEEIPINKVKLIVKGDEYLNEISKNPGNAINKAQQDLVNKPVIIVHEVTGYTIEDGIKASELYNEDKKNNKPVPKTKAQLEKEAIAKKKQQEQQAKKKYDKWNPKKDNEP